MFPTSVPDALGKYKKEKHADDDVRVNLLNPGATRTKMRAEAFPGEDPLTLKTPDIVARALLELVVPECTKNGELIDLGTASK